MSSLALVTIRSSIASPRVGLSITWVKKLSSVHSRSLPGCLQLTMLLFQQMSGWLKSPIISRTVLGHKKPGHSFAKPRQLLRPAKVGRNNKGHDADHPGQSVPKEKRQTLLRFLRANDGHPLSWTSLWFPSPCLCRDGKCPPRPKKGTYHMLPLSFPLAPVKGWGLNHFPGQPVPMLDNPLGEEKFPNIQSKPPLAQLEAISSCPITCYLGEETDPHLSTTSFQAKQSQLPQPLLRRLLLQTLHQLRCPSLYALQYLNIPLVVGGPKLNTVFENFILPLAPGRGQGILSSPINFSMVSASSTGLSGTALAPGRLGHSVGLADREESLLIKVFYRNAEAKCQGLPAQEMVSDLPPPPSGDNELKPSDLLSRKERARAGFVPWGMTGFGREIQADRHLLKEEKTLLGRDFLASVLLALDTPCQNATKSLESNTVTSEMPSGTVSPWGSKPQPWGSQSFCIAGKEAQAGAIWIMHQGRFAVAGEFSKCKQESQ
ncbi:hypothetical protein QYF61_009331, partial [Mycteria americana]